MRILYISDSGDVGGAEANLLDLLANLDRDRVEPFVAVPAAGRVTFQLAGSGTRFVLLPVPRPGPRGFTFWHWWQAARAAASLTAFIRHNRIDLVHAMTSAAHLVGGMAARKAGVPAIWHARRPMPLNQMRALMVGTASAVIAPWQCVRETLLSEDLEERSTALLHDGIDFQSVLPHTGYTLPERAALPKGTVVFGLVGNESPTSGHDTFLAAAGRVTADCEHTRCWVVGRHTSPPPPQEVTRLGPRDDLGDLYHAMNCVVIPSRAALSGRVALEAAGAGRPIIATAVGAHTELFADGGALLIPPGDAEALARAMRQIQSHQELRWELAATARRIVSRKFAVRFAVAKLTDLYNSLLARHPGYDH